MNSNKLITAYLLVKYDYLIAFIWIQNKYKLQDCMAPYWRLLMLPTLISSWLRSLTFAKWILQFFSLFIYLFQMMAGDCMGMLSQKLFEPILSYVTWLQQARILNFYILFIYFLVYCCNYWLCPSFHSWFAEGDVQKELVSLVDWVLE